LLFSMADMSAALDGSLGRLEVLQSPGGGFVWFEGGPEDRFMTQYILTGIGRMSRLGAIPPAQRERIHRIAAQGLSFLDRLIKKQYDDLLKQNGKADDGPVDQLTAHFLYMRSFFPEIKVAADIRPAYN